MLKRQLVLDSFLFIGYSFTDDLVLNALREIKEVFPNQGKIHYRFVKEKIMRSLLKNTASSKHNIIMISIILGPYIFQILMI